MQHSVQGCWIRFGRPSQYRVRVFCFPFAGGSAQVFQPWRKKLPEEVDLLALQLPGRANRYQEPPLWDMDGVTADILPELIPRLDLPFVFVGHSLGAAVAYELSRQLYRRGLALPQHLVVSGCRPVQFERRGPYVHQMSEADLLERLRVLGAGIPGEVLEDVEIMRCFIPAIRADFRVIEQYRPPVFPPLPVNASIWGGRDDPLVPPELNALWSELFTVRPDITHFDGGHMFIAAGESGAHCVGRLRQLLAECFCDQRPTAYKGGVSLPFNPSGFPP